MALLHVVTFLIHAVVAAMASMLGAVMTRLLPALLVLALLAGGVAVACTSCGVGGLALLRRRKRDGS